VAFTRLSPKHKEKASRHGRPSCLERLSRTD